MLLFQSICIVCRYSCYSFKVFVLFAGIHANLSKYLSCLQVFMLLFQSICIVCRYSCYSFKVAICIVCRYSCYSFKVFVLFAGIHATLSKYLYCLQVFMLISCTVPSPSLLATTSTSGPEKGLRGETSSSSNTSSLIQKTSRLLVST